MMTSLYTMRDRGSLKTRWRVERLYSRVEESGVSIDKLEGQVVALGELGVRELKTRLGAVSLDRKAEGSGSYSRRDGAPKVAKDELEDHGVALGELECRESL